MRNQRFDYKKKMKNQNRDRSRRTLMKRASTLTLATTLALSVPVTSLSLNVSGTQIVGSQTAYAQGGNLIDPRINRDVSIYKDDRGERVELQLSLSGSLNTSLDEIGDQDLIFTVQLPSDFNNIFGTEEFANSFFYLAPNGPIVDSNGSYVVSLPEVTVSEVEFDST
ncbi:hypothetical protein [Alkalicoccobacillus plakortidis]|uniref:Uncharacterized protein n=1 Tax=Alkalicoccobacillus plakortidis TaxID=444060 RepID=A0ABT0XNM2_9BACI|nr:hypothetical protein [Alkalicoccobacillus plakortidis]MCM2677310.1 hypothetical protein [Alkalicoccobacillus plakortidis]